MKRKVAFKTLGCRLNQYETDAIAWEFNHHGYQLVGFNEEADAYVINTCTVTNHSDHKSRYEINKAARKKAVLVVTGCMAASAKEQLMARNDITYVVENDRKLSIFSLLNAHFKGELIHSDDLTKDVFGYTLAGKVFHTRSLVKIQDGCNRFCTFCIVPYVRGRATSRPADSIISDIRQLVDNGSREIVITGVNIGRYRHENISFESLVENILDLPGNFRLRISSIEPDGFGERLLDLFSHPKLTPYLHLCLQSGSDTILNKMKRSYTVRQYMNMVHILRSRYPSFNLTTDIMVGFPGETEQDFEETCRIARDAAFSHIHTFKFSPRKGTQAEKLNDHVPEIVKNIRSVKIREISDHNKRTFRKSLIGATQEVLIETVANNRGKGYGEHFVPVQIYMTGLENNMLIRVKISGLTQEDEPVLIGEPMKIL